MAFPSNPSIGDTFTLGGKTYRWNGTTWGRSALSVNGLLSSAAILDNSISAAKLTPNVLTPYALDTDLTTANVVEVGNLYFTNARSYANVVNLLNAKANTSDLVTSNVVEGANLYFTNARTVAALTGGSGISIASNGMVTAFGAAVGNVSSVNGLEGAVVLSTANIAETGSLYFTNARVYSNVINIGYASNTYVNDQLLTKANVTDLTTSNITETGGRNFFTNTRAISALTGGSGISIASNGRITANISATATVSSVNGLTGDVTLSTANIAESGNLYYSNTRVQNYLTDIIGNVIPSTDSIYNLGSFGKRWKDIFLSGNSIYLGDAVIQANGNAIIIPAGSTIANQTTDNIAEGSNIYFTNDRVYSNVVLLDYSANAYVNDRLLTKANVTDLTTANVSEVSNLYFTNARVYSNVISIGYAPNVYVNSRLLTKANVADLTTTNVTEGDNLYFTNARVRTAISEGTGVNVNAITGVISIGQNVSTHSDVIFSNVTVTGNLNVQGNAVVFESNTLIIIDPLIQVGKNPTGDAVDLGFFAHYIGGSPSIERHAGLFRDASDGQFKLFTNLDPEPTTIVDTANSSYTAANLVVNYVVGKVTDISNHSTSSLTEGDNLYFTNARVYANVIAQDYSTNSYVNNRLLSKANVADLNTSNVIEGANLYFTNTRAIYSLTAGSGLSIAANGLITSTASGGGGSGTVTDVFGQTVSVSNAQLACATITSGVLNTGNVVEGANLYFTNTRSISALTSGSGISIAANGLVTSTISGTVTDVFGQTTTVSNAQLACATITSGVLNTGNVIEGANLYFTNTRAVGALTSGSGISIAANGLITSTAAGGGGSVTVSNDEATNAARFIVFEDVNTGTVSTISVSSSKLQFNPSTGTLSSNVFSGNGAPLSSLNAVNIAHGTLGVGRGGTGTSSTPTNGQLLIGNGTNYTLAGITGTTNQITVTNGSGSITLSGPQDLGTGSSVQHGSFGVGTAASGTTGEIRATNNITAYYSDRRLKKNIKRIENALDKISKINGVSFQSNEVAQRYGYTDNKVQIGVIAQEIEKVLPEVVVPAPFDIGKNDEGEYSISGEHYKTVQYDKLVPLLIEAIKELKEEFEAFKRKVL